VGKFRHTPNWQSPAQKQCTQNTKQTQYILGVRTFTVLQTIRDCLPKGDGYKLEVKIPNGILELLKFAGQGRAETYSNLESGVKKN
jgi:hypothetical protein